MHEVNRFYAEEVVILFSSFDGGGGGIENTRLGRWKNKHINSQTTINVSIIYNLNFTGRCRPEGRQW